MKNALNIFIYMIKEVAISWLFEVTNLSSNRIYAAPLIFQLHLTLPDGKLLHIQKIKLPTPWGANCTDRCNRQSISPCLIKDYRRLIAPGCAGQPVATSVMPYS